MGGNQSLHGPRDWQELCRRRRGRAIELTLTMVSTDPNKPEHKTARRLNGASSAVLACKGVVPRDET